MREDRVPRLVLSSLLALLLVGVGLIGFERDRTEASHPISGINGNRAVIANWLGGPWDVDVLEWVGGWATHGLPSGVRNSSYYPHNAWNDSSFPTLWVTKDVPGDGAEVYVVILAHPGCSNPEIPCQTYEVSYVDEGNYVYHAEIYYLASSTGYRCSNIYGLSGQSYNDCIATTISHEVGHALVLDDHSNPGYPEEGGGNPNDGVTIMETPPDGRKLPNYADKQMAAECIYVGWC